MRTVLGMAGIPADGMKARQSLRGEAADDAVRQVLLESLEEDGNPGVRVEAVNLLVRSLGHTPSDTPVVAPEPPENPDPSPSVQAAPAVNDPSVQRVIHVLGQLQRPEHQPLRSLCIRAALPPNSPL